MAEVGLVRRFDAALLSRRRFRFRVEGDADAVWARILADPAVREADDPAPEPAPPQGAAVLASRSGNTIRVRHWSGTADAVSPVLVLRIDEAAGVARVEGHLEQPGHAASFRALERPRRVWPILLPTGVLVATGVLAYVVAGSALLWTLPLLLLLFAIPSSLVMLPALALWNAESRRVQREALVGWMGRTFVPIALPAADEDDPFR